MLLQYIKTLISLYFEQMLYIVLTMIDRIG